MTTTVLNITTSLFGANGNSSQLNQAVIERLSRELGDIKVVERDLVHAPLPYFDADFIGALSADQAERNELQQSRVALADSLIAELQNADILVVAAPMYNFGIPAQLKTWVDYVARAGTTFRYTSAGPEGLLGDRPVYITTTRGGVHFGKPSDSETIFLTTFFNFLGLKDLRFIYAEGLNMGQKEVSFSQAHTKIDQWVQQHA